MTRHLIGLLAVTLLALPLKAQVRAAAEPPLYNKVYGAEENGAFTLRLNLLRWATLTPDVGLSWRVNRDLGLVVHGTWANWRYRNARHKAAIRELSPELRLYLGERRRAYVGAMYKVGAFNLNLNRNGKQGNFLGGGLTGGYQLPIGQDLSLDLSLAVGYLSTHFDRFHMEDKVRVYVDHQSRGYFGPINVGATLAWTVF